MKPSAYNIMPNMIHRRNNIIQYNTFPAFPSRSRYTILHDVNHCRVHCISTNNKITFSEVLGFSPFSSLIFFHHDWSIFTPKPLQKTKEMLWWLKNNNTMTAYLMQWSLIYKVDKEDCDQPKIVNFQASKYQILSRKRNVAWKCLINKNA